MRIYVPAVVQGAEWITLRDSDPDQWEALFALLGPVGHGWQAPRMRFIREQEDSTPAHYSDFPWCLHNVLIIRDKALQPLRPVLEKYGELLPLPCEEALFLFNVTNI